MMAADPSANPIGPTPDTPVGAVADYGSRRPVFYVPYRALGREFIGREATLEAVRQQGALRLPAP